MCKWDERENEELNMIVRDMIVNRVGESGDFSSLKDFLIGSCCSRLRELVAQNTPSNAGWEDIKKERVPPGDPGGPFIGVATTYFPTAFCSIIGATGLNFSVRNGKRWTSAL